MAGVLVRLPVGRLVETVLEQRVDFIAVDLASAPVDEIEFRRIAVAAHAAGVCVVAVVADSAVADRPLALGADTVVSSDTSDLAIIVDAAEANAAIRRGASMVALDVEAAMSTSIATFVAARQTSGPATLVLLAGMLGDARLFDDVVARLPDGIHCQPARIDLDDSIDEMAATALASAPARFALVGHSLGGIVALAMWRREPHRVTRLALLNSSAREPSAAQRDAWNRLRVRTETGQFDAVVAEQAIVNLGPAATEEALVLRWSAMASKVGPDGFLRQLQAQAGRPDSTGMLHTIDVRCLVVSGAGDEVCPPSIQAELAAAVARAEHVEIPGAGHMTPLDRPAEVAAALTAWLLDD